MQIPNPEAPPALICVVDAGCEAVPSTWIFLAMTGAQSRHQWAWALRRGRL